MFFQTCAKLAFCLTQIYFLAITAWYRVYSMCFLISRNAILGFRKNMSQCLKGFQGNLNTTIIKNSPDWFRSSLNVRDYCKRDGLLQERWTIAKEMDYCKREGLLQEFQHQTTPDEDTRSECRNVGS